MKVKQNVISIQTHLTNRYQYFTVLDLNWNFNLKNSCFSDIFIKNMFKFKFDKNRALEILEILDIFVKLILQRAQNCMQTRNQLTSHRMCESKTNLRAKITFSLDPSNSSGCM